MHGNLLEPFLSAPERAGIFLDFDGTLSRIALTPEDARPIEGAREVLARLSDRFAVVAIVSGRAAADLVGWLGPDIEIWGVHGAETVTDGRVVLTAEAEPHRALMQRVLADARQRVEDLGIDGVLVEDKTTMVNLHYRMTEDAESAEALLDEVAEALARDHGLRRASGRLTFELRPPAEFSKAKVVLTRAKQSDLSAVLFAGDDTVDIPAFEALDELASDGMTSLRVAVMSTEAPRELIDRADVVVSGPEGMLELLERLVNEPG